MIGLETFLVRTTGRLSRSACGEKVGSRRRRCVPDPEFRSADGFGAFEFVEFVCGDCAQGGHGCLDRLGVVTRCGLGVVREPEGEHQWGGRGRGAGGLDAAPIGVVAD